MIDIGRKECELDKRIKEESERDNRRLVAK
jgi:hypothetical protein